MLYRLKPHPVSDSPLLEQLSVSVQCSAQHLRLCYRVQCSPAALKLPETVCAGRADGLWQHTCFEMFVQRAGAAGYREFNFSPSGQWAVYDFSAYRVPAGLVGESDAEPLCRFSQTEDGIQLRVEVPRSLMNVPEHGRLRCGLTAVIESCDHRLQYWSLAHPRSQPDFHDAAGWIVELGLD